MVRLAVDEVNRIQHLIDIAGITNILYAQDLEAQLLLTKALNAQDSLWKEKARNPNFIHGDRNTSYFHRLTKVRAVSKNLSILQDGENILSESADIEAHVLSYFQ